MKKEEIYVVIDSEEKRLRAIQILTDAKEIIWPDTLLKKTDRFGNLFFDTDFVWGYGGDSECLTEITLDQLEQLLSPELQSIKLDALKLIAESYGFELVEKKQEIKIGDFGKFWDDNEKECCFSFLHTINNDLGSFESGACLYWSNFRHLTDEEKAKIQENW